MGHVFMNERVVVLMSTYNGEAYLQEQIQSLCNQRNVEVQILVRDDGSTDSTKQILRKYQKEGVLEWYAGENLKAAYSFMDLVFHAPEAKWYAFCDQDDVWLEDKLERALHMLEEKGIKTGEKPCLYYGKPRVVNQQLELLETRLWKGNPNRFESSVIENLCTGCTMVFNDVLLHLVQEKRPEFIIMHDEWFHKVCNVHKGVLCWDEDVHILYRQHKNNVTSAEIPNLWKRIKKHCESFYEKPCPRSRVLKSLYDCYKDSMDKKDLELTEFAANYKRSWRNRFMLAFCQQMRNEPRKSLRMFRIAVILGMF